ncbi:MAG: hypothetical protein ACK5UX_04420 [Burkholderiales bacterium]|nr:hypothetical protein [Nitrosomonadaceae bacterium]
MSRKPLASVVLFVSDVLRVANFYRELGAMCQVGGDAAHAVLEVDGFQLVVHQLRGGPEPSVGADGGPLVREDAYTKICIPVESIAAARERARLFGGSVRSSGFEWQTSAFRACDGHDPEGNVIQVREAIR